MTTVQDVIDDARIRHHAFVEAMMPDGAALRFLNERQRAVLLSIVEDAEQVVGEARELALTTLDGAVVGVDSNGIPFYATDGTDGYAVALNANGVPYLDTSTVLALDPFGESGGTPGIPLPTDLLRITAALAVASDGARSIEILPERIAITQYGNRTPRAFINGGRLVPIRLSETDQWSLTTSIRLSMVRCPVLASLADVLTLPDPCLPVLTAALAEFLSGASKGCTDADRRRFTDQRREAESVLRASIASLVSDVTESTVIYRRR